MKNYKIIILITMISLLTFDLYFLIFHNKGNCLEKQKFTKEIAIDQFRKLLIAGVYKNELQQVDNCQLLIDNKEVKLQDMAEESPVLIFRFSIFNCSACVHFALEKLKENFNDFATNKRIVLIYDDENMRVSEDMFGKMPYITTARNILRLPMENSNIPFLFILDKEMKTKQFFVPEKGMPSLTDEYLSIIKTRYFSNEEKSSDSNTDLNL